MTEATSNFNSDGVILCASMEHVNSAANVIARTLLDIARLLHPCVLVVCGEQIDHYPARPWSGRPACHAGVCAGMSGKNVGKDAGVASWKLTPRMPRVFDREWIVPVISAAHH